jgi:hypothetical protein
LEILGRDAAQDVVDLLSREIGGLLLLGLLATFTLLSLILHLPHSGQLEGLLSNKGAQVATTTLSALLDLFLGKLVADAVLFANGPDSVEANLGVSGIKRGAQFSFIL